MKTGEKKSREEMTLKRNIKRMRAELRIIYDELRNEAENDMIREFREGLKNGELYEYYSGPDNEDLQRHLVSAIDTYFGIESGSQRNALPGS